MMQTPILWSFRRCPYAIRARLAVLSAGVRVELRDIPRLRDKPQAFLDTSPTATVPCLKLGDRVIDESLEIMVWALENHDPHLLLDMST
ncbi:MAG: glutathione S-transferase N-terminal domain-containing protein, partial [Epibacterium sp.]|nr:glutathione S-transferase N-terminal domain-containing protein [Epibacterium sp.]NQX74920.1 glutathione S-transferase N-terminal domain-containing protein [Epibacterium sp.]